MIQKVRDYFSTHYAFINIQDISDAVIHEFLNRTYVKYRSFDLQMNLFQDYVLANDLTDVQE